MKEYGLTEFEERLFVAAGTTERIRRFKRSSLISTILFSGVFAALAVCTKLNWLIAAVLAVYALINLTEVRRFAAVIASYSALLEKISGRTAPENVGGALRKNALLLTVFYIILLAVLFLHLPAYASIGTGIATIGLLWLYLRLKLTAANTIIAYKNEICEVGKANEAKRK